MFIKNKKSGLAQECSNKDVIKICQRDVENYEVTEVNPVKSAALFEEMESGIPGGFEVQPEPEKSLEDMTGPELKTMAKERGIEGTSSLNKEDLLAVLKDVE
jgi:hypothetical protein